MTAISNQHKALVENAEAVLGFSHGPMCGVSHADAQRALDEQRRFHFGKAIGHAFVSLSLALPITIRDSTRLDTGTTPFA
jgi:hypothetical protein